MKDMVKIGNDKMGPNVMTFSLPPVITCRPSKWCLKGRDGKPRCYALRGRMTWPNVTRSFRRNYEASKKPNFVDRIVSEIEEKGLPYFRIHVAGDFYSASYARKWIEIANRCPGVLFRTTTRRVDHVKWMYKLDKLPNMSVRESIDPISPVPKTKLRVASAGVVLPIRKKIMCQDDCEQCGHRCWTSPNMDEVFEEY